MPRRNAPLTKRRKRHTPATPHANSIGIGRTLADVEPEPGFIPLNGTRRRRLQT